jgi:chromosome segregation ATPase
MYILKSLSLAIALWAISINTSFAGHGTTLQKTQPVAKGWFSLFQSPAAVQDPTATQPLLKKINQAISDLQKIATEEGFGTDMTSEITSLAKQINETDQRISNFIKERELLATIKNELKASHTQSVTLAKHTEELIKIVETHHAQLLKDNQADKQELEEELEKLRDEVGSVPHTRFRAIMLQLADLLEQLNDEWQRLIA